MTACERLADALKQGGKTRGYREPKYKPDGTLDQYAKQMIEIVAGDVVEACALVATKDEIVKALEKGSAAGSPERKVTIYADDLFHLLDCCK